MQFRILSFRFSCVNVIVNERLISSHLYHNSLHRLPIAGNLGCFSFNIINIAVRKLFVHNPLLRLGLSKWKWGYQLTGDRVFKAADISGKPSFFSVWDQPPHLGACRASRAPWPSPGRLHPGRAERGQGPAWSPEAPLPPHRVEL